MCVNKSMSKVFYLLGLGLPEGIFKRKFLSKHSITPRFFLRNLCKTLQWFHIDSVISNSWKCVMQHWISIPSLYWTSIRFTQPKEKRDMFELNRPTFVLISSQTLNYVGSCISCFHWRARAEDLDIYEKRGTNFPTI